MYSQLHCGLLGDGFELLGGRFELLAIVDVCFAADISPNNIDCLFVTQLRHSMLDSENLNFPSF